VSPGASSRSCAADAEAPRGTRSLGRRHGSCCPVCGTGLVDVVVVAAVAAAAARNIVVSVDVDLVKLQFEPVWLVVQRVRDAACQIRDAVRVELTRVVAPS
jgi:hypothetical protein